MTEPQSHSQQQHGSFRSARNPVMLANVVQVAQLLTLVIGLVLVSMNMGAKGERLDRHDSDLKELRAIVGDLTSHQVSLSKDGESVRRDIDRLDKLEDRLRALEANHSAGPGPRS